MNVEDIGARGGASRRQAKWSESQAGPIVETTLESHVLWRTDPDPMQDWLDPELPIHGRALRRARVLAATVAAPLALVLSLSSGPPLNAALQPDLRARALWPLIAVASAVVAGSILAGIGLRRLRWSVFLMSFVTLSVGILLYPLVDSYDGGPLAMYLYLPGALPVALSTAASSFAVPFVLVGASLWVVLYRLAARLVIEPAMLASLRSSVQSAHDDGRIGWSFTLFVVWLLGGVGLTVFLIGGVGA